MATGGGKQKSKGQSSSGQVKLDGIGGALIFTGGAMVGAAVLYGMKKLYDHFTTKDPEDDVEKKEFPEDDSNFPDLEPCSRTMLNAPSELLPSREPDLSESLMFVQDNPPHSVPVSPLSDGTSSIVSVGSLHESLFDYYISYVDIPEADYQIAMTVVDDIKASFRSVIEELMPNCPLGKMVDIGPASEGLAVVRPDYFQVGFQLSLAPKLWELVDAGQTLLTAHGYQMVKRAHLKFFSRGTSFYDKYLIGEYLSPVKIKSAFLDLTNRVSNWRTKHRIESAVVGPEVKLIVIYGDEERKGTLTVEFIPTVNIHGTEVLAEPHTSCKNNTCYENLWLQSFRTDEIQHLTGWKPSPTAPIRAEHSTMVKEIVDENDIGSTERDTEEDAKDPHEETARLIDKMEDDEGAYKEDVSLMDIQENLSIEGCQLMCLKILEAVRLNHPAQLRILSPYIVRTIVMKLMTLEDGWFTEQLSERFLDTLKLLEEYLRARQLPHFFCPKVNLLENYDSDSVDHTREFIASIIGNNQFNTLLKRNY